MVKASLLQRTPLPRRWEFPLLVAMLIFLHGAFMMPETPYILGRHPLFFIRIGIAGLTLLLIYNNSANFLKTLMQDRVLLLLHLVIIGSVLWSIDRGETISAAIGLVMATLLGVYIAANYSSEEQLRLCIWVLIIITIFSIIAVVLLPERAIMHAHEHEGRWAGILGHKNDLGYAVTLLAILLLYSPVKLTKLPRWFQGVMVILALMTLYFTQAAAAIASLAIAVVIAPFYKLWLDYPHFRKRIARFTLIAAVIGIVLVLLNLNFVFGLLGRDSSLTGRTQLWWASGEAIKLAPILGYGYEASFVPDAPIQQFKNWKEATHAHDVFLQVTLDIGLVGLAVFLWQYLRVLWRAGKHFLAKPAYAWGFPLIIIIYTMVGSLTVMPPISLRRLVWVMYVAVVLTSFAHGFQLQDTAEPDEASPEVAGKQPQ